MNQRQMIYSLLIILTTGYSLTCFSQTDQTLEYFFGKNFQVYRNLNSDNFLIRRSNEEVVFDKLTFVKYLGDYLQVLDQNNSLFYLDTQGLKVSEPNLIIPNIPCACIGITYGIVEKNDKFIITEEIIGGERISRIYN